MAYLPIDLMTSELRNFRRLKVETSDMRTAYGDVLTSAKTPVTQISAKYGFTTEVLATQLGGSTSVESNMFICSTGTGANNVAAIISAREAAQKAGQGLACDVSAVFTEGQPNSLQQAGFVTSESSIGFGYDGERFGVIVAGGGALENQELTITVPPSGTETAVIEVDGVAHNIEITGPSINETAYQIATALNAVEPRYRFASSQGVVSALARLPDFGVGAWSFTSPSAAGTWVEIKAGVIPTENWVYKEDWNGRKDFNINPTLYNEYRVQVDANIKFYVKDPVTGDYELAHIYQHLNNSSESLVGNPTFRVGWACRNTGNTTDLKVRGFFAASFVEGDIVYNQLPFSKSNTQLNVGGTRTNVIAFRNRSTYQATANRSEIIPKLVSVGTDSTKPVIFEVVANPITDDYFNWEYLDETESLMEFASNPARVVSGVVVGTFVVNGSDDIDIQKIVNYHIPTVEYSITATTTGGNPSAMIASGTWQEDK